MSHKSDSRLPLLSARPEVTLTTLKRAATNFAAWWKKAQQVWTVCLRLLPDSVMAAIWTQALLHPIAGMLTTQLPSYSVHICTNRLTGWKHIASVTHKTGSRGKKNQLSNFDNHLHLELVQSTGTEWNMRLLDEHHALTVINWFHGQLCCICLHLATQKQTSTAMTEIRNCAEKSHCLSYAVILKLS